MSEKFCANCEDYRATKAEDRTETYKVRGREIPVPVHVDVCLTCGETLFDKERDSDMLHRVYAAYRRMEQLLTPEEIKAIRRRYRLSQESFASLLGMSEATINRYEQGCLQDAAHDAAIRACETAQFVKAQLELRGHLLSDWQRQRVEQSLAGQAPDAEAVLDALGEVDWICMPKEVSIQTGYRRFAYHRFARVATWFCARMNTVCTTTMNKLLFYADFLCFKVATVSITGAAYRKLQHGPAPADYGGLLSRMESEDLLVSEPVQYPGGYVGTDYRQGPKAKELAVELTPTELAVLEKVANEFQGYTAARISERSHRETAWLNTPDKQLISYDEAANLSLSLPE